MAGVPITVEEADGRASKRRFLELAHLLYREEPRWAAPLVAWERLRLDRMRNRYLDDAEVAHLLLRRLGKPAGRITAHVAHEGDEQGWFGFFDVVDDPACTVALIEAATEWLRERGCTSMRGPASFTEAEEAGVLVAGFDVPGATGRPWHPPWYAASLVAAGLAEVPGSRRATWRLPAGGSVTLRAPGDEKAPDLIGPYADPRVLLPGIAAVPDLASVPGATPWQLARRAKRGEWETCVIVRWEGDPAQRVPALLAAAGAAGYAHVISPWSPDPDAPPETEHALFELAL